MVNQSCFLRFSWTRCQPVGCIRGWWKRLARWWDLSPWPLLQWLRTGRAAFLWERVVSSGPLPWFCLVRSGLVGRSFSKIWRLETGLSETDWPNIWQVMTPFVYKFFAALHPKDPHTFLRIHSLWCCQIPRLPKKKRMFNFTIDFALCPPLHTRRFHM